MVTFIRLAISGALIYAATYGGQTWAMALFMVLVTMHTELATVVVKHNAKKAELDALTVMLDHVLKHHTADQ